jgi:hypothetical protein
MAADRDDLVPPGRLRVMQTIAFSQIMAVIIFIAVVVYLVQQHGQAMMPPMDMPIMSLLALGMLGVLAVISYVVPHAMLQQGLRRIARRQWQSPPGADWANATEADELLQVRQTTMIFALALVEGPAFFLCIAYLLEGRPYVLGAAAAAVLLQIARFPTSGRLRGWLRRQLEWIEQERARIDASGAM